MAKKIKEIPFGDKWVFNLPGNANATIKHAVENWITLANAAVDAHGAFYVALAGGSTPQAIYQALTSSENKNKVPWDKVFLFWSDERSVPPTHPESNYRAALEAGLGHVGIPEKNIFRMVAETEIEKNATLYQNTLERILQKKPFDLIMLGMGEDGHTASLFPHTDALHTHNDVLVAPNFVPALNTWRLTFTPHLINRARHINLYVLGRNKSPTLERLLTSHYIPDELPVQRIGTPQTKAHFFLDDEAAAAIPQALNRL